MNKELAAALAKAKFVKVRLVKSKFGRTAGHGETITGLGLSRTGDERILEATPSVVGMIRKVHYLLQVEAAENK